MAGFFPIFFKGYWNYGVDVSTSTFRLGLANSTGSLFVILLAPLLGAIADKGRTRKKFLFAFTLLGVVLSASLSLVPQGNWQIASLAYILAIIGFSGALIFYDSLLIGIASPDKRDMVSSIGFGAGYLGGGLLFGLNVFMALKPSFFGLPNAETAIRISFVMVSLWWIFFSLPLLRWVPEPPIQHAPQKGWESARHGVKQLISTFHEIRRLRVVFLFLIAYWLYIDGVDTIVRMAVDYGMSLGFDSNSLIVALLITQFVGFPSALVFGMIGGKIGTKKAILIGLCVYTGVTIWAVFMNSVIEFYGLAVVIGLVQGGVQSLSRSLYSRIIPQGQAAEFFGFYNMLGKFAAIIGPLLMGGLSILTGSPRISILSIVILFVSGGILLCFVDEKKGADLVREIR
ncbi:MAG: MFS transporter [Desulfobulbaceae bacterium]|uniref:MFS transporter n=1 Tax=Candidatus Desulfobia pelagia TaxID=2841692 RepID=A0A8J6NEB8_9BACT|nr:MFS transporter [Candidatus Desulfobia pelagia]